MQATLKGSDDAFATKLDSNGQIVYSTYIGGSRSDGSDGIRVDSSGAVYMVGTTTSFDFPVTNAVQRTYGGGSNRDFFVLKLSPEGSALIYSTYLGGGGDECCGAMDLDSAGNVYVCGGTTSINFPTANSLQSNHGGGTYDAFIAKLNPTGTALVYSTYLGGSGLDRATAIKADAAGNAWVAGFTISPDFPTKNPFQPNIAGTADCFLAEISPQGDALLFSSYLGGTAYDEVEAMTLGSSGDIYLAGFTYSYDFPTVKPLQPQNNVSGDPSLLDYTGFVVRYDPASNSLVFSTYFGGSASDWLFALALDSDQNVYVGGQAHSQDFPITPDAFQPSYVGGGQDAEGGLDGYFSVLNSDGSRLIYSTYLGGSDAESVNSVALDPAGNVFLAGRTFSTDFPVKNPALPNPAAGPSASAAFLLKLTAINDKLPALKVIRSGETLLITWPASVSGAVLESTASFPAAAWTPVPIPPVIIGDQNAVTVDIGDAMKFYRLKKP